MLSFRLFGIPVGIRPSFWLIALLLGFDARVPTDRMAVHLVSWVVIVLVSVLAHELGHAVVARRYGASVSITLFVLGGYTTWESPRPITALRRVVVAASGSVVGFALGAAAWLGRDQGLFTGSRDLSNAVGLFVAVNVFWGLLNWLPIRPLDGGHIFTGLLQAAFGRTGERIADVLFPLVTLAAGLWAWSNGLVFAAILAGFVMLDEIRRWIGPRTEQPPPRQPSDEPPFSLFGDGDDPTRQRGAGDGLG